MRVQILRIARLAAALSVLIFLLTGCGGGGGGSTPTFPTSGTITSTGGSVSNGTATLTVPGGAVSLPTTISIQAATGYSADARMVTGTAYRFDGNGVSFVQPVNIQIAYTTANIPTGGVESSLALFKLVSNAWTQVTGSTVDTTNKIVRGADTTLGVYAVFATVINGSGTGTGASTRVMFTSDRTAAYTTPNLYTINSDGTGIKALTNLLQGESVSTGFFKPDGTKILFTKQTSGGSDLDIINADGTGLTRLVGGDTRPDGIRTSNHNAEFSADGARIAFASDRTGEDEIYIMNADGTGITALTQNFGAGNHMGPVSFTQAGRISFTFTYNGTTSYYLINTDGTALTQVTAGSLGLLPWWSYSPSGANIVYAQAANGTYDVYVASATNTGAIRISSLAATAIHKVRYSHDGTRILFDASIAGAHPDVYAVNPDGTSLLNLTNNAATDLFMDAH